jgi:uncharacterized protein YjbI with pentapeptide repeats
MPAFDIDDCVHWSPTQLAQKPAVSGFQMSEEGPRYGTGPPVVQQPKALQPVGPGEGLEGQEFPKRKLKGHPRLERRPLGIDAEAIAIVPVPEPEVPPEDVLVPQSPPPVDPPKFEIAPVPKAHTGGAKVPVSLRVDNPLQAAIDAAPDGAIINVPVGVYRESLLIAKNISLVAGEGQVEIASNDAADAVRSTGALVTLEGFKISVKDSQSANAVRVEKGRLLLKNCHVSARQTVAVIVRRDAGVFLIGSTVEALTCPAVLSEEQGTVVAEDVKFSSQSDSIVVDIRGESLARFSKCKVEKCKQDAFAFGFAGKAQFLFENAEITGPIDITACTEFGMIKDCRIAGINLTISRNAICYVVNAIFTGSSLEAKDCCGVRLINNNFLDSQEQPGLLVYDRANVEAADCTFKRSRAGAAAVVYKSASLKFSESKFVDLSGVGILAFNAVQLGVHRCAFANCTSSGIFAHQGASVSISDSLVDRVLGVGITLRKLVRAEVARSKVVGCALSGLEATDFGDLTLDHCIFEQNGQCGLIAQKMQKLAISNTDFVGNKMAGLDARESQVSVTNSVAIENVGGGVAFRTSSHGEFTGGGMGQNQQFGVAALDGSTVSVKKLIILQNPEFGALANAGSTLLLDGCTITKQEQVGVFAQGQSTKLTLAKCILSDNGTAIQAAEKPFVALTSSEFSENTLHVEVSEGTTLSADASKFKGSKEGLGVFVTSGSTGNFTHCEFSSEAKSALASDSQVTIQDSSISECGICGLFWYGQAKGEVTDTRVSENGPCGIQIMGGQVTVNNSTIEGHTTFGIHVQQSPPSPAQLTESGNTFQTNSMLDINYEK